MQVKYAVNYVFYTTDTEKTLKRKKQIIIWEGEQEE